MDILILTKAEMEQVMSMREVIEGDKEALAAYSKGDADIPLRTNIAVNKYSGQSLYMPGYVQSADSLGLKIVSVYPENVKKGITSVPGSMILLNAETGEIKALMDATFLTQLRTGAVSGAATDLLARKDSSVFALIGTGGQAQAQLEAVLAVRPIKEVKIFSPTAEHAAAFTEKMQAFFAEKYGVTITAVRSSDEAVKDADIITAVTTAKEPVFNADSVKKGAHINGVGSYMPDMQELPEEILQRAGKIYVDTRDGVLNESGDIIKPVEAGWFSHDKITGELGELVLQKTTGRESTEEITVFKTTGSAVLDLVIAEKIYAAAVAQGLGTVISM